ncbi:MAG: hypothetical protein QCH99_08205 [Candidatus Bathyarchaeota archaeon]|nr:hypothetical protein [Candidatus Bathyarchaeum tardum]
MEKKTRTNLAKTFRNRINSSKKYLPKRKMFSAFPKVVQRGLGLQRKNLLICALTLIAVIFSNTIYIGFPATNTSSFVVDDKDAVFVGNWGYSSYIPGFYGEGYRYNYPGSTLDTATWSFNIPQAGSWEVFAIWSSYNNRATNAPYTINHAKGETTVTVNQQRNGGEWISLGTYNFEAGQTNVKLTDDANNVVIADAIKLVPINTSPTPPPEPTSSFVIDDKDAVFVGNWGYSSYIPGFYGEGYRYNYPGSTLDTATWSFNIPQAGSWEVFAIWSSYNNRATNAPYTINHAKGETTVTVNQQRNGGEWISLGTYNFEAGQTNVKLTDDANNVVIADAIKLVPTETSSTPPPIDDPQTTSKMVVGVNFWGGTKVTEFQARDVPLLKEAGIEHLRVGVGISDSLVNAALDEGIDVIGTFGTNGLPDLNTFGNYVYNRVLQFKGRINAWVVFNEANWESFPKDPQGYTQALKVAYTRAKQADPNVKIITSNFLSTEPTLSFLKDMYNAGAANYFDILGIDPYCFPEAPTEPNKDRWGHTFWNLPAVHELMVKNGDGDKPIWIIEFGYRTPSTKYPLGHSTVVSETKQATYLVEALELAQNWPWLERFYIYQWMDSADVNLGNWGIIKEDYRAPYELKPAYYAVKQFNTD